MTKKLNISDEEFLQFAHQARSLSDLIRLLSLNTGGGTYRRVLSRMLQLGIDVRNRGSKGATRDFSRTVFQTKDILEGKHPQFQTNHLKQRLLKERVIENKCDLCQLGAVWNGVKLVLELDHVDGNRHNHKRDNLRLLCPNCHSQTKTYKNKTR
jgi:hypothetical protein